MGFLCLYFCRLRIRSDKCNSGNIKSTVMWVTIWSRLWGVEVVVDLCLRFVREMFRLQNAFFNLVERTRMVLYVVCH
jgi:hypothetical protein